MLIIPAIDLKNGQCVRLRQGDFSDKTVYSDNPVEMAQNFRHQGARRLHIVDLDGAQSGKSKNKEVILDIVKNLDVPIQLGGGIRSHRDIGFWLDRGISAVIIGTLAIRQPEIVEGAIMEFGSDHIVLSVDAKDGQVMSHGWQNETKLSASELALKFKAHGLSRVLYTDISRDGMFSGPNLNATKELALQTGLKVTASGGISSKADVQNLIELEAFGVDSVVIGKAIYENKIKLEDIL